MPITLDQRQQIVRAHGKSPGEWDYDENTGELVTGSIGASPPTAPETTTTLLQKPEVKAAPSLMESVGRSAAESAIPTGVSLGTMALAGSTWLGGPATGIPGTLAILGLGAGAGIGASALQKHIIPQDIQQSLFTTPESQQAHPIGSALGGFLPSAIAFNPLKGIQDLPTLASAAGKIPAALGPVGRTAMTAVEEQALLNAAMNTVPQAAISGYQQATSPEPFNMKQFLAETLPGLLFTRPTGVGKAMGFHEPISPEQLRGAFPSQPEIPIQTTDITPNQGEQPLPMTEREKAIIPKNIKGTEAGMAAAERKEFAIPGMKHRDEARLMEEAQARMEAEGGKPTPPPKEEPPKDIVEELARNREEMEVKNIEQAAANKKLQERMDELNKRQSVEPDLREQLQTEVSNLQPEQRTGLVSHLKDLARRRGFKVREQPEVLTPEGKSIAGNIDLEKRQIQLATGEMRGVETPIHEGAGHGFLNDLLKSSSKGDNKLGVKALNAYSGTEKFKTPEDWFNYTKTNPEEAYRAQTSVEETLAKDLALEGTKQSKIGLYGTRKERLQQWLKGAKSRWKTEFELQNPEDIRTHLIQRYRGDAPYGTRPELSPLNRKVVIPNEATQDQEKGKEVLTPLDNTRESTIQGVTGETPLSPRDQKIKEHLDKRPEVKITDPNTGKSYAFSFDGTQDMSPIGGSATEGMLTPKEDNPWMARFSTTMEDSLKKKGAEVPDLTEQKSGNVRESVSPEVPYERPPTEKELDETQRLKKLGIKVEDAAIAEQANKQTISSTKTGTKIEEKLGEASFKAAKESEKASKEELRTSSHLIEDLAEELNSELKRVGHNLNTNNEQYHLSIDAMHILDGDKTVESKYRKIIGDEAMDELIHNNKTYSEHYKEHNTEVQKDFREKFNKASFKAQEGEAFTRPDVERQSEEADIPYKEEAHKYPTSYSFNRALTSRLDKVGEKINTPTAHEVTYKLRQANTERDLLEGRIGNKIIANHEGFTPEEIQNVRYYRHEIDNGFPAPLELTEREQELKTALDKTYKEIGQMFIDSGLKVKSGESFRSMKLKPEGYQENMLAGKVADAWMHSKPEGKEYDKLFLEHAIEKGMSDKEAQTTLDDYKQAIGNAGITPDVKFGALRKVEGIGLPWELTEQNGAVSARRYGRRAAADLAFFKYIQNDPRMQKALGIKDQFGKRVDSSLPELKDVDVLGHGPEVTAALRSIYGIDLPLNPVAQSAARIIGANIMQTGTALRNLLQLPTSIAPYYGVNLRTAMGAVEKMHERTARAFENNAIKSSYKDFDAAGEFEGNPNKFIAAADKYVSFMRKWTGRDLSDKLEGLYTYSLGEELANNWFAQAKDGDIKARAMLNRFGTTVDGGVKKKFLSRSAEVTSDDIQRVAKEFVDVVRGSYSAGGLPSAAIEGPLTPFLSLSRWSVERANNFYKDAVLPIKESGNWTPFLKTTLSALLTGYAIEQLNEALGGKRGAEATTKEVWLGGDKSDILPKAIGLAQLGSLAGIMGDTLKFGSNLVRGKETKFSSPISFPLASIVEDLAQKTSFAVSAIHEGEDPFAVLGEYMKEVLRAQSQNGRYVLNQMDEESKRKEKFRDLRVYRDLKGAPLADAGQANPFLNLAEKKFKKEEDLGKAIGEDLPKAIDDIVAKSDGDYEKLRKGLEGLKANSYQTFPSPTANPMGANDYYDYLVKTQGKEAADARLVDFMDIVQKNKIKARQVPTLRGL